MLDCVQALLDAGADANHKANAGGTPLITAAYYGKLDFVKTLLDAEAETHHKNRDGLSAMDIAKENGHQGLVDYLTKHHPVHRRDSITPGHPDASERPSSITQPRQRRTSNRLAQQREGPPQKTSSVLEAGLAIHREFGN